MKKMVPTHVLVEIASTITVDPPTEAMKKMVPTHVLVEIASTITVDPPTEATRRWIVTQGISQRSRTPATIYDTAIKDVIEEEEGFVEKEGFDGEEDNIEDVVVVANDLCSSMIQTSISVDFSKTINSNPHELIWLQKDTLPFGRGMTVYILPPSYLASTGLGIGVAVVVNYHNQQSV
nr:hypothetical protein [Tanacetum cinerariifolium]